MTLKGFVTECHKKEVFKMLSIYIVSSWVLLQVLALVAEPLGFPIKIVTYFILILLVGFPVYIYYIWKFKLLKYEIQQTEDPTTPYNKSAFQKMYFSSLLVISLLSGVAVTLIIKKNFSSKVLMEELAENDKIAVLDFENTTGNEELNNIGEIAANWIIHGITENDAGQAISSKLVNDYKRMIKSDIGSESLNSLLIKYLKPSKVIEGAFYMEKDELLLQGSIKNGLMDETLMSFETVICDPNEPLDCAEQLKQQILGYLSTEDRKDDSGYIAEDNKVRSYYEEKPPSFKAYQYLLEALEKPEDTRYHLDLLNKAIELDPNFFEPKIHMMSYYYNEGEFAKTDSIIKTTINNSRLNTRQKNWISFYESIINGKNDKAYRAILKEYNVAALDVPTNQTTMTIALQYMNRPEDIQEIYDAIPMDDLDLENCQRCGFRYYLKALADIELGNYEAVLTTLSPVIKLVEGNYLKRPLIMAFIKSDQLDNLDNYLSEYALSATDEDINYLYHFTGLQLINSSNIKKANEYFNKIISRNNQESQNEYLANAYYYLEDFKNASMVYNRLNSNNDNNSEYLVHLAISQFKNSNRVTAKKTIERLENLRSDYQFGEIDYRLAQFYASTDRLNKALKFILKSIVQGYNFTPTTYHNDPHFKNLKNNLTFKEHLDYWKNKTL
ncbi:hypothetical protein [Winogradskyella alexanderae]|uniref:Tetratricopeptide repeat protein n=1 Tax=Winogradskyella alexanderae TaxID=2877123 RepID=A0ABS7XTP6_9FLAO|nr:hypothetical protein [Winogradskyella alexanderae]MCA0132381.1 hypothetical protein [Winogradskyella alexanderae]